LPSKFSSPQNDSCFSNPESIFKNHDSKEALIFIRIMNHLAINDLSFSSFFLLSD